MSILSSMRIAATSLTAQRLRMDVIASNIANVETTRTPAGGPYQRNRVVFAASPSPADQSLRRGGRVQGEGSQTVAARAVAVGGVMVTGIVPDPTPPRQVYDPDHPDADGQGNVAYPSVDVTMEMADMLSATRAYEASVTIINATKGMATKALEIGRG